jgi:hypothetical protein
MDKTTVMIMYGAMTVAFVFLGYKFVNKIIDVSSEIGALLGGIAGLILSIALWYTVGKKLIKVAS